MVSLWLDFHHRYATKRMRRGEREIDQVEVLRAYSLHPGLGISLLSPCVRTYCDPCGVAVCVSLALSRTLCKVYLVVGFKKTHGGMQIVVGCAGHVVAMVRASTRGFDKSSPQTHTYRRVRKY